LSELDPVWFWETTVQKSLRFAEKVLLHIGEDFGDSLLVSSAGFSSGPSGETALDHGLADLRPIDIACTDFRKARLHSPILHLEFDNALSQSANSFRRLPVFLVVSDTEIVTPRILGPLRMSNGILFSERNDTLVDVNQTLLGKLLHLLNPFWILSAQVGYFIGIID